MAHDRPPEEDLNAKLFDALIGAEPYRWQAEAFGRLMAGDLPDRVLAPTAAGKLMMIPVWLAALAARAMTGSPGLQRRLVFVVNRRVLVDEATRLAERIRDIVDADAIPGLKAALASLSASGSALHIATLRGQFVDNGLWAEDPTTPAIILATPDMLGSRLLFRGYGLGRNRAAMQAGLLAMDTLVVHDEAHLAPAFGELLRDIECRVAGQAGSVGVPPLQVIDMSATDRAEGVAGRSSLHCDPAADAALRARMAAPKHLRIEMVAKADAQHRRIVEIVGGHAAACKAVAVFVSSPATAQAVAGLLTGGGRRGRADAGILPPERVVVLTGTMRGAERDALLDRPAWQRVAAGRDSDDGATAVLIATSAGEIGIDLDADVLVCDAATIDRQIQRFGRANRRGRTLAELHLVALREPGEAGPATPARGRKARATEGGEEPNPVALATHLLARLPEPSPGVHDASPLALTALRADPDYASAIDAAPPTRELEDGILELFAATSFALRDLKAPDPALWIHGLETADPEVELVWRIQPHSGLGEWLARWPVHGRERARLPASKFAERVVGAIARRCAERGLNEPVWLASDGSVLDHWRGRLLPGLTLLIDCRGGGLDDKGLVAEDADSTVADVSALQYPGGRVAVHALTQDAESELWHCDGLDAESPEALIGRLHPDCACVWLDVDADGTTTAWLRPVDGHVGDGDELFTRRPRLLAEHLSLAARAGSRIAAKLPLRPELAAALVRADHLHDLGKQRRCWQLSIGNRDLEHPLGKSGGSRFDSRLNAGYRHELGSLVGLDDSDPVVRHLIAAHHGHARPAFPDAALAHAGCHDAALTARDAFDTMALRHGHWGVAYLEALAKCGDILAETLADALAADPEPMTVPLHGRIEVPEDVGQRIPFDPANPGEYLAAIGLLWLLALHHPQARLAWDERGARYVGADAAAIAAALAVVGDAGAARDDRHAALILRHKPAEKYPPLRLALDGRSIPINAWCNARLDDKSSWRFSAGRSDGLETLGNLIAQCRASLPLATLDGLLQVSQVDGIAPARRRTGGKAQRFRFDAGTSWTALDVGWSPYEENMAFSRPWIETLALLGVQHTFPPPWHRDDAYATWTIPRTIRQVPLSARGLDAGLLHRYSPRYLSSGQNTDTFTATATTTEKGVTACPQLFVI